MHAYNYKRQVRPTFLDTGRRNITVAKGGLAELRCRIRNLGPKEVGKTRHAAVHIMENSNQILRPNSLTVCEHYNIVFVILYFKWLQV